ncbi:MAG: DinB family protein [Candidatus Dormibacteria bacterium]
MEYLEIPRQAQEKETLVAFLAWQRDTLALKCAGLTAEQLRGRSAPPSPISLLGLVCHMAEVERGWFRQTLAAESLPDLYETAADEDRAFNGVDEFDVEEAFANWRTECQAGDGIIADRSLDAEAAQKSGREVSLRWILVHMVEEYSRHNGHADLIRERIDGAVGY